MPSPDDAAWLVLKQLSSSPMISTGQPCQACAGTGKRMTPVGAAPCFACQGTGNKTPPLSPDEPDPRIGYLGNVGTPTPR